MPEAGYVPERKTDRLVIVGFCQSSRDRTPWDDPRYTIFSLNRGYIFGLRSDVHFDLHSPTIRNWQHRRPKGHMDWLRSFPGVVYLHEPDPEIPNGKRYPFEEVTADVGGLLFRLDDKGGVKDCRQSPYFDSSIAYELALGIHMGFKQILMTGVDLNTDSEYVWQRSGVSFYLGLALGRGIEVVLPDNCPLLTGPLYGRGFLAEGGEHLSASQLETRLAALKAEHDNLAAAINQLQGAHAELVNVTLAQMVPGVDHEAMDRRRVQMEHQIAAMQGKAENVAGALKEIIHLISLTPDGMTQEEAEAQIRAREVAEIDVQVNGYHSLQGEELSEGDMSALAVLDEPGPVAVNGLVTAGVG